MLQLRRPRRTSVITTTPRAFDHVTTLCFRDLRVRRQSCLTASRTYPTTELRIRPPRASSRHSIFNRSASNLPKPGYVDGSSLFQGYFAQRMGTDPWGRELVFSGDRKLVDLAKKLVAEAKKANPRIKEKLEAIEKAKAKVEITVVSGDKRVDAGSFVLSAIDLEDINRFPRESDAATRYEVLMHEVLEQWEKQANNEGDQGKCHRTAKLGVRELSGKARSRVGVHDSSRPKRPLKPNETLLDYHYEDEDEDEGQVFTQILISTDLRTGELTVTERGKYVYRKLPGFKIATEIEWLTPTEIAAWKRERNKRTKE